ncbi:MAG: type IV toxin-antitoxin system AbiEi family antitoxin [Candidatus Diapherotrites archaeon]
MANKEIVFTTKKARAILKTNESSTNKLIFGLIKKKWVERIEKGKYVLLPLEAGPQAEYEVNPLIVAGKLIEPYYVGFWSALNHYGITEQPAKTVFIASTKQKKMLKFHNTKFRFIKLKEETFFGFKEEWVDNVKILFSDKEKTIIDCLYLMQYSGGLSETLKAFKEKIDYKKLTEYALKVNDLGTIKRLGYLLEKLGKKEAKKLKSKVSGGYACLDSNLPAKGNKNKEWRIIENADIKDLLELNK